MIAVILHLLLLPSWFGDAVGGKEFDRASSSVVVFVPLYPGDCAKCTVEAGAILRAIEDRARKKGKRVMVYTLVYAKRENELEYMKRNGYTFGTAILDPHADRIKSLQKGDRNVLVIAYRPGFDGMPLRHVGDVDTLGL